MLAPDRNEPARRTWIVTAAVALLATVVVVTVATRRSDDAEPIAAAAPAGADAETAQDPLPAMSERERGAVESASSFFAAFGSGDVGVVTALSDPEATCRRSRSQTCPANADSESELVRWWAGSAWPGQTVGGWPTGACRVLPGGDTGPVLVECPLSVADPVAIALGADALVWVVEVSEDGAVRRRAEPLTPDGSTYAPVWTAYVDHLSAFRPEEYAAVCSPSASLAGQRFEVNGLALTGACAELTSTAAPDVAAWISDGRPEPSVTAPPPPAADNSVELPLTSEALAGYWTNVGGRTLGWTALFVDFRHDGRFTIGNTGALGDGAFTGGTYEVDGDEIVFTGVGGGCDGQEFRWTTTRFTDGALDVDVTPNGGCAPDAGWNWVRVSPASRAGVELAPGSSGAAPQVPEKLAGLYGIWLRVETGEVLGIDIDGSYIFTKSGNTLAPDDTGRLEIESAGVVVFTSDGSGACAAGDVWTWTDVSTAPDLLRDGNPRGTTMRAGASELCGSADSPLVWRLLSPDLVLG